MVYKSRYPLRKYPTNESVYDLLFKNNTNVTEDTLLYVDTENPEDSYTYGELHTQILKTITGFKREFDLQKGDVVAICSPNQIDYPVIIHGTVCTGGAVAAIDQASSAERIASDFEIVKPKVIISHKDTLDKVLDAAQIYGHISTFNILIFGDRSINGIRTVRETLLSGTELGTPYPYTPEELDRQPSFLYFTSGTTGRKKAVMITQRILATSIFFKDDWPFSNLKTLAYTEFHHVSSLVFGMTIYIYSSVTSYVMPHYTLPNFCSAIETFKINLTTTQPFVIAALAKGDIAEKYDFSSLKFVLCGGAALDEKVTTKVKERLGINILNAYGMTEVLGLFDTNAEVVAAKGIGLLAPNFEARIVDSEGNDVPEGQMGELWVRGPTVTLGYYGNPEATAATFDSDGYLHTGDLFRCDENGIFFFIDREKDLIKYLLYHIYPSDIEKVLMKHPKVSDCAVIGVYCPEDVTELPRAYVELVDGEKENDIRQEILEYANSRLPDSMQLRGGVIILNEFPRTGFGKIQRHVLRQNARN